jgi:hypothetical protein
MAGPSSSAVFAMDVDDDNGATGGDDAVMKALQLGTLTGLLSASELLCAAMLPGSGEEEEELAARLSWDATMRAQDAEPADALSAGRAILKPFLAGVELRECALPRGAAKAHSSLFMALSTQLYGSAHNAAKLRALAALYVEQHAPACWLTRAGTPADVAAPADGAVDEDNVPYPCLAAYVAALRRPLSVTSAPAPGDMRALEALVRALGLCVRLLRQDDWAGVVRFTQHQRPFTSPACRFVYLTLTFKRGLQPRFRALALAAPHAPPPPPVVAPPVAALPAPQALAPWRAPSPPRQRYVPDSIRLRGADADILEVPLNSGVGASGRGGHTYYWHEERCELRIEYREHGMVAVYKKYNRHTAQEYEVFQTTIKRTLVTEQARVAPADPGRASGNPFKAAAEAKAAAGAAAAAAAAAAPAGPSDADVDASQSAMVASAEHWEELLRRDGPRGVVALLRAFAKAVGTFEAKGQLACGDADTALGQLDGVVQRVQLKLQNVIMRLTLHAADTILIVGGEGAGKSFLANRIARALMLTDEQLALYINDAMQQQPDGGDDDDGWAAAGSASCARWEERVYRPAHDEAEAAQYEHLFSAAPPKFTVRCAASMPAHPAALTCMPALVAHVVADAGATALRSCPRPALAAVLACVALLSGRRMRSRRALTKASRACTVSTTRMRWSHPAMAAPSPACPTTCTSSSRSRGCSTAWSCAACPCRTFTRCSSTASAPLRAPWTRRLSWWARTSSGRTRTCRKAP